MLADDDPAAPLRLRDTSTDVTVTLAPGWSAAMLLETETSTRHRRGDRRLVASCALGDGGAMVALRLDVDEAFAARRDTTVTTPLGIEGGMAGECAVSTDGARVAVIDAAQSQVTLVELDGHTPPRRFPGVYDRVAFAGTDTLVASSELGVEVIAARTGTVTQVLRPGGIEIAGPGVTYKRAYSRTTMLFSGDPVLIDEHGRLGKGTR